jgi:Helix-turn-helix domain
LSVKIMAAVWELDLPLSQKLVALAFADFANDNGDCWPSIELIAWKCGYSERQTQSVTKKLRKNLILEPKRYERGGRGRSTVYRVHPENGAKLAPFRSAKRVQFEDKRVQFDALKGEVATAPEPPRTTTLKQPPKETHGRFAPGACEEAVSFWNENCGVFSKVQKITPGRKAKFAARLRADPDFISTLKKALAQVLVTPFLRGEGSRGWKVTFDWLIENDGNAINVLEGSYENGGTKNANGHNFAATDKAAEEFRQRFN